MTNRNKRRATCQIEGCGRAPIHGYRIDLCADHRQHVVNDIVTTAAGERTCIWPGCKVRTGIDDLRICNSHMAVVIDHAANRPMMKWTMVHLENYHWGKAADAKATAAAEAKANKVEAIGLVYFLRIGGYIKIGWTSDLTKRMKGYPPDTQLLATMPGTRKDEGQLHKRFAHLKTHGREWFPLAPQITEYIDRVIADHGEPPAVDFSARRKQRIVGPRLNRHVGGASKSFGARHVS